MSPIVVLLIVIAIGASIYGVTIMTGFISSSRDSSRKGLRAERERSKIAQVALREIAAGNEMPIIIAGSALDEIHETYGKELQND